MSSTSLSNVLVSWNAFSASSLVLVEAYEKNPELQSVDGSEKILSPPAERKRKGFSQKIVATARFGLQMFISLFVRNSQKKKPFGKLPCGLYMQQCCLLHCPLLSLQVSFLF